MVKIKNKINTFKKELSIKFQNLIYYLGHERRWSWLDVLIDGLCNLEVNFKLAKNKQLLENLEDGDISAGPQYSCWNFDQIPDETLYCDNCPFRTTSSIARFFYGYQSSGYCYYLNRGDFSFGHPTELIWDGCKECGIHDELDIEDESPEDISTDLIENYEGLQKEINKCE